MIVRKAYKFKLKTNLREQRYFSQVAGCTRLVWNKALALQQANCDYINQQFNTLGGRAMDKLDAKQLKNQLYKQYFLSGFDIITNILVPIWKRSEELSFLKECPAQALQKPLTDLDKTFKKMFKKECGFPRFKKKGTHDSIYFPQGFKIKDKKVFLPKIGWIKFFKSRNIEGKIKNITVTSEVGGDWFVSFCTEEEKIVVKREEGEVGIDLGVTTFATTSDQQLIPKPPRLKVLANIKKRVSRALNRKKKGGTNRKKAILTLRKVETKIANIRKDFLHKTSTTISKNHALIAVEKLKIKNMTKSAKGSIETPGLNVKAKSGLNREILANGWGMFKEMLKYKQAYSGGIYIEVSPINTSRKCSYCSNIDKDSRLSQDRFVCTTCKQEIHADINAAINILAAGRVAIVCGDIKQHKLPSPEILSSL